MARKHFYLLLIFVLLLLCGCSNDRQTSTQLSPAQPQATQPEVILTLDDVGGSEIRGAVQLTNMGLVNGEPDFIQSGMLVDHTNNEIMLLDLNGNPACVNNYDNVEQVLDNGKCIVSHKDAFGIYLYGIADTASGQELVECDAVEYQVLSSRYVLLSYIDELTTDRDYYGSFYRGTYLLYYHGYGRIYDLQLGRFVPDYEMTGKKRFVTALGELIIQETEEFSVKSVFDSNGQHLGEYVNLYIHPKSGIALQTLSKGVQVYNSKMEPVITLSGSIYEYDTVPGSSEMLVKTVTEEEQTYSFLMDLSGKRLSQNCSAIRAVFDGQYILHCITATPEEGEKNAEPKILYGVVDFRGNTLIEPKYNAITYQKPGYFVASDDQGCTVYSTDGKALNTEPLLHHPGSPLLYVGAHEMVFILQTGQFYTPKSYPEYLCLSLIFDSDQIIDVVTGQVVMEDVDDCMCVGNNLYVWSKQNECYTRYLAQYK